ncbi:MAG: carbon storage regulator [Polyangiaceae bacterium]
MFIVARRKGQRIVIGNDIEIVVTDLSRSTVKLGIVAPKPYSILRGEICEQIEQVNREALKASIAESNSPKAPEGAASLDATFSTAKGFLGKPVKPPSPDDVNRETVNSTAAPSLQPTTPET